MDARARRTRQRDATPVLILGMPRSGTTLVEQIVSNHPEVRRRRGIAFLERARGRLARGRTARTECVFCPGGRNISACCARIAPKAARVTDKMPFNFLWAGLIHMTFPRAMIIHCRRTPSTPPCRSIKRISIPAWRSRPAETIWWLISGSYQRLTDHWRACCRRPLHRSRLRGIDPHPEPVIRRIIAACGLPWHDACLQPESILARSRRRANGRPGSRFIAAP